MATSYAYRTMDLSADGGYTSRFVFSAWVKRSKLSYSMAPLFSLHKNNSNTASKINFNFNASDQLSFTMQDSGGSEDSEYQTNRVFRDTNSWYHIYLAFNSTLSTAADRLQIYVNGVRETSFAQANEVGSTFGALMTSAMDFRIGTMKNNSGTAYYFDGLMNSAIFTNYQSGTVDPVTDFGEVDSTTGEWKIKVTPAVTYATQGVFVLKNGNSLTDASGQSNNMTVGGTLTATKDCPDNVFATMNPLDNYYPNFNLANGNTSVGAGNGPRTYLLSTMGLAPTGKYYWEIKLQGQQNASESNSVLFGISQKSTGSATEDLTDGVASSTVIDGSGRVYVEGSLAGTYGSSYAASTVMCLAYDAVNNKMYFGKDGTWLNSGDPTSGSTGTGAFTPTATNGAYNNIYMPCWGVNYNSGYSSAFNFGNGYFNTTAVSSAGTNASGNGIFEHNVPSGYTALSTKGLNL